MNLDKRIVDKKTFLFYFIFSLKFNFSICWSQREFNVRYYSEERPTHFLLSRKGLSNRMNPFGRIHNLANNQFALIGQCPDQRSNKKNSREVPRDGWLH